MKIRPELITLCIKQDRKAEYQLYKESYGFLMGICLRYAKDRDTASETLNMGFMKILSNLKNYKPEIPFSAWIRRIMINTLIDEYRKHKKEMERVTYVENYYDNSDYSEVNEALAKISYDQIILEINKLPIATRKVFNLFAIDGFSHKEIGELLDISEGTSKWHLNSARQKLKQQLENKVLVKA